MEQLSRGGSPKTQAALLALRAISPSLQPTLVDQRGFIVVLLLLRQLLAEVSAF